MKLYEYVQQHTVRGACTCGKCIDSVSNPEENQPNVHTVDMVFFEVAKRDGADVDEFRVLVEAEFPRWLDGGEHNYIEMGADIGDQGIAMMTMALGGLLGIWKVLTPALLGLPKELQLQMAGMGMLSIQATS